jgi:hypothetical protein
MTNSSLTLRTAAEDGNGSLDKETTSYDNILTNLYWNNNKE